MHVPSSENQLVDFGRKMSSKVRSNGEDRRSQQYEKRAKRRAIRALHDAISKKNFDLVHQLLTPDLDVNFHYSGQSALQIAVLNGLDDIAEVLITHGADVNKANSEGNSLLNMAAWRGHVGITRILIKHAAELDVDNNRGSTALNSAAYQGYTDIAELLVNADCSVDKQNLRGETPLITCAKLGHVEVARVLVKSKCHVDWQDVELKTALITAAERGHADVSKLLIQSGCDLNIKDRYGCTALWFAAKDGNTDIVEQLIDAKADLDVFNNRGCTAFLEAVTAQHENVIKQLSAAGCDINRPENNTLQAPILIGVRQATHYFVGNDNSMSIVATLIASQCDLNAADKYGWTPLFQACHGGETEIVRMLLKEEAKVDKVTQTGDTPLHAAVFGNKPEILRMLFKAGCQVNATNNKRELPLYTAIHNRAKIEIVQMLLDEGSLTDVCSKDNGQTPLFAGIQQHYVEAVDLLLKAGCNVNLTNDEGDSALWLACDKGNEDIVDTLLKQPGIDINVGISHVPLHAAVVHGHTSIVVKLLDAGCNVNQLTDICITALYLAADANSVPITKMLIEHGANPTEHHLVKLPQKCCRTYRDPHPHFEQEPLQAAIKNDNFQLVKLLLSSVPKMPYPLLMTLRDLVFRTNYAQDCNLSEQVLMQYARFFTGILSQPRRLQESCRGIIRQTVGCPPEIKVQSLPIPSKLKDYILMKSLLSQF